jgi:phosphoribosylcarboxyaminoimidazole (NCAIR) mutase
MAVGPAGARNAALFAIQILALSAPRLQEKLKQHKLDLEAKVLAQNEKIPVGYHPKG